MKMALVFLLTLDNLSGNHLKAGCSVTLHTRDGPKFTHDVEEGSSSTKRELQDTTERE